MRVIADNPGLKKFWSNGQKSTQKSYGWVDHW